MVGTILLPPIYGAGGGLMSETLNEGRKNNNPDALREALSRENGINESLAKGKWAPWMKGLSGRTAGMTARLLEHQALMMNMLDETTRVQQIGNFDKFAFPLIRAIYPNLIANEIVSVQPMSGPTSLVFYFDILFGTNKGRIQRGQTAFDAISGPQDSRFFSSDDVVEEVGALAPGGSANFQFSLSRLPVRPGTVEIRAGLVQVFDDGQGVLVGAGAAGTVDYASGLVNVTYTVAPAAATEILATYRQDMEANDDVPQLDLLLTSSPINARERKLRARWSLEAAQNLNALHGLDAEAELVAAVAEQIKFEIDRSIINDLFNLALAGNVAWPTTTPFGISFTEHKLSFIDAMIEASNLIFAATRRGQPNFMVVSIDMANIIETQPTFVPESGALSTQSTTGVVKLGTLNGRWTIFKDPFFG